MVPQYSGKWCIHPNALGTTSSLSGRTPVSRDVLGAGAGDTAELLPLSDRSTSDGLSSGMDLTDAGVMDAVRFGGTGAFRFFPIELMEFMDPDPFLLLDNELTGLSWWDQNYKTFLP